MVAAALHPPEMNRVVPLKNLLDPPYSERQFRAIGLVSGRFIPDEGQLNPKFVDGVLFTPNGSSHQMKLRAFVYERISTKLDETHCFKVYPRCEREGEKAVKFHGIAVRDQSEHVPPNKQEVVSYGYDKIAVSGRFSIRGRVKYVGQAKNGDPAYAIVEIKRFDRRKGGKRAGKKKPFDLRVFCDDIGIDQKEWFCDFDVILKNGKLTALSVNPVFLMEKQRRSPSRNKSSQDRKPISKRNPPTKARKPRTYTFKAL